jgi:hypothetical protein
MIKEAKRIKKTRYGSNGLHTLLTTGILEELNFKDNGKCKFEGFENMNYWVKNGICLFYNTPISTDYQDHFYIGYAEMRQGKYVAVAFKWIDSLEELTQIYEGIVPYKIEAPI